jgi:CheY-like chemotaxis protein
MGKVMVVDDAAAVLKVMEDILQIAGYEVCCYDSADEIEDRIAEERPDLLLLDIVVPNRTGYEALRGVKEDRRTRHTPVVFVNGAMSEAVPSFLVGLRPFGSR